MSSSRGAPARVNVMDLEKYMNQKIRVKFSGGREFVGTLKGFDQLVNIVLDDAIEYMRGEFAVVHCVRLVNSASHFFNPRGPLPFPTNRSRGSADYY